MKRENGGTIHFDEEEGVLIVVDESDNSVTLSEQDLEKIVEKIKLGEWQIFY